MRTPGSSPSLGAGPLALARAHLAQTARLLIETTPLPMAEVAFAAGFSSIRAFNDTVREVYALSPSELRTRAPKHPLAATTPGALSLRLPFRTPLNPDNLFGHLAATAVPRREEWRTARTGAPCASRTVTASWLSLPTPTTSPAASPSATCAT